MGIYSLATVTSAGAWINFLLLFVILYVRGPFPDARAGWSAGSLGSWSRRWRWPRRCIGLRELLGEMFFGGLIERVLGLAALVGTGGLVYFGVALADRRS